MDIFEALRTRRSIRKYTDEPITDGDLQELLEMAMLAPSAKNEQPWQFVVVRDGDQRAKLAKVSPYTHMAAIAPLVIVVCGDMREEKAPGMWVQDCSAATQNLLLACTGKQLGAVWCGVYPEQDRVATAREILGLPEEIIPLNLVCIGHTAEQFKTAERYRQERVHLNRWNG